MNRLQEIEKRLSEIRELITPEDFDGDIDALTSEADSLESERKSLLDKAEKRKQTLEKLASGEEGEVKKDFRKEEKKMENTINKRQAFCKYLLGHEMSAEERSALTIAPASAGAVVPTEMAEEIISKVMTIAPVLADMELLHVNGQVSFAVEGVTNSAGKHEENAKMDGSDDTMIPVTLNAYEITKLVKISGSVKNMSLARFESWLIEKLVERIAKEIERQTFNGTGEGEAKGINKIAWTEANSVTVTGATTSADVLKLFGLLKTGYARKGKAYMNRTTLFNEIMPLQDKAKNDLVKEVGGRHYLCGALVEETDEVANGEILFGAMKMYAGNLAEEIHVVSGFDIDHNQYKYLGVAMFDGKPALEEAFVKLVKSA